MGHENWKSIESRGVYIDRDIECSCIKIWDYRDNEPNDFILVDCQYE